MNSWMWLDVKELLSIDQTLDLLVALEKSAEVIRTISNTSLIRMNAGGKEGFLFVCIYTCTLANVHVRFLYVN